MKQKKLWFDQRCDLQSGNGTFTMPYWYISIYADISKLQQWTNWNNVYLWQKHIHWLPKRYVISLFEISTLQQSGTFLQNHIHLQYMKRKNWRGQRMGGTWSIERNCVQGMISNAGTLGWRDQFIAFTLTQLHHLYRY